jgi:hypothetical protein
LALAALTLLGGYWRLQAWDPPSLWLDDQWVGIVTRKMTLRDVLDCPAPAPLGFLAIQALLGRVASDPEWPLQVFPIACNLLLVPLLGAFVARLTGRRSIGFLAASLTLISPGMAAHAVRAKPFASDALATMVLLGWGWPLLRGCDSRSLAWLAAGGLGAVLVSFNSTFVSLALVNLAAVAQACRPCPAPRLRLRLLMVAALFDAAVIAVYALVMRAQANTAVNLFWTPFYLPTDSLASMWEFLRTHAWFAVGGAFLPELRWMGLLVLPSLIVLLSGRDTRWHGLFTLTLAAGLLTASALRLYPLGTGRTDIFLYPLVIVMVCHCLHVLTSWRWIAGFAGRALVIASAAAVAYLGGASTYVPNNDAELVRRFEAMYQPGDGLLLHPYASVAVGYYTTWPIRVRAGGSMWGFHPELVHEDSLSLFPREGFDDDPALLGPDMQEFLREDFKRILFIGTHLSGRVDRFMRETVTAAGYIPVHGVRARSARVVVFERREAP